MLQLPNRRIEELERRVADLEAMKRERELTARIAELERDLGINHAFTSTPKTLDELRKEFMRDNPVKAPKVLWPIPSTVPF